jgi:hypothetical protein
MRNRVQAFESLFAFGQIEAGVGIFCTIGSARLRGLPGFIQVPEYKRKNRLERKLHTTLSRPHHPAAAEPFPTTGGQR